MMKTIYISNADSGDISVLRLASADARLVPVQTLTVGGTVMPLAVSPCRRYLYAARRSAPMAVCSFAIDPHTGKLAYLAESPLPASMAYISTDRSGRFLFSASYPGDVITVSSIDADGVAQPVQQQIATRPHAHCIVPALSNRHVFATSLGGGVVMQYCFDPESGRLSDNQPGTVAIRPGAGPRHFRLHPGGKHAYLLNELDATIDVFALDADQGTLHPLQTIASLPPGFGGEPWAADMQITPDGRFLYSSERRSSTLAGFAIDPATGRLEPIGHFPTEEQPRGFAIDPDGRNLIAVGQLSHHLTHYAIDQQTGALMALERLEVGQNPNWVEIITLPAA